MSVITKEKIGIFHYSLTTSDGEHLDSSEGKGPLPYLHGAGNIISGLEREMEGKTVGDKFTATIVPEDAFGVPNENEDAFMNVPRADLPEGITFQKGMQLIAEGEDGEQIPVWMLHYEDDIFTVTTNHPLAGLTLVFSIEVVGIRDALPIEIESGHPYGLDGTAGNQ